MIRFGPYRLDPVQGLAHGEREVRLTPRSLAVLVVLAGNAGRVVTKDELFASVWHDAEVTDAALATCIQEIRRALGDSPRDPRFIETLHRRGYRFVAETAEDSAPRPDESEPASRPVLVGREQELGRLFDAFSRAQQGSRQVLLITGEPGVGKSALLAEALAEMRSDDVSVTWSNCVQQYGSGEPYQPLLDALMRLCRGPRGAQTIAVLERFAPMWLAQLPGLLAPQQAAALQQRLVGTVRDRMLRELANAVEALAAREPLVLAIEDLHWSDPSTLDWISNVASRLDPAKLLLITTVRPTNGDGIDGQVALVLESLSTRRLANEIALAGLPANAVTKYLLRAFPPAPGSRPVFEQLAERVHRHTGGNPLFMSTVLEQLVERGIVKPGAEAWIAIDVDATDLGIPETIRPIIDRQIAQLGPTERIVLEAASVIGERFALPVAAEAAGLDEDEVETALGTPAGRRFIRSPRGSDTADERTASFEFTHALFREAFYGGIPRSRRAALHGRVAIAQERSWGPRAGEIAAELGLHFELAGDDGAAIVHLQRAGDSARRRSAFREARRHYEHALELLARQPDDSTGAARELDLQIGLGAATMATAGFGAPPVEAAYSRARELGQQIGDTPGRFPALFGLWLFYWGRGEVRTADALAADLRRRAAGDPDLRLQAAHSSWSTAFSMGAFAEADGHARAGLQLYDRQRHAGMAAMYGGHDPAVCGGMFAARATAIMGMAIESVRLGEDAIALARSLEQPFSLGLALTFRAASAQTLRDLEATRVAGEEATAIARDQGFRLMLGWCLAVNGWAAVQDGDVERGSEWIDEAIATTRSTGSDQFLSYLMASRAEAHLASGRPAEALAATREGFGAVDRTAERFYEAELHRLHGEALVADGADAADAAEAFRTGVNVAQTQGANLLALRSAVRLHRLLAGKDGSREALAKARGSLPPSSLIPDVAEADALLGGPIQLER